MICKVTIIVAVQFLALVAQTTASEMRASLANKVAESDLVAIIKINAVERGKIHVPHDWQSAAQDFKMDAVVIDRIKGDSPETIVVTAYSTSYTYPVSNEHGSGSRMMFSTAGFSAYGIEPGESYIAYLREEAEGKYRLSRNSNQCLERISSDGAMVNDIGQTLDQVSLAPKIFKLRVLSFGMNAVFLAFAIPTLTIAGIWIIRKQRKKKRQGQLIAQKEAEQVGAGDAEEAV